MRLRDAALPLLLLAASLPAVAKEALPWVENDYGKAVAEARAAHVPIFAEAWAPW